jgi:hypothetical protein
VDLFSTIADGAACGAFFGAAAAYLLDERDLMADWLLIGTVFGGTAGIGRVIAGV